MDFKFSKDLEVFWSKELDEKLKREIWGCGSWVCCEVERGF